MESQDVCYTLEKAFFEETILLHESGSSSGPTMKLALLLEEKPLGRNPSQQDLLVHSIHDEKRAVDFYKAMAERILKSTTVPVVMIPV